MLKSRVALAALFLLLLAPTVSYAQSGPTYVSLKTSQGEIILELDRVNAPRSVDNFLQYTKNGHYDGTIFHRVIGNFMIQGGGFDANMQQKATSKPIANEAKNGLKNKKYTVAMARTNDPHSATAQFFINTVDNAGLDYTGENSSQAWGYAVFGKVVKGQEVVDKIAKVKTGSLKGHQDVPIQTVTIETASILDNYAAAKN